MTIIILSAVLAAAAAARQWARWEMTVVWLACAAIATGILCLSIGFPIATAAICCLAASAAGYFLRDIAAAIGSMLRRPRTIVFAAIIVAILFLAGLVKSNPGLAHNIFGWLLFFGIIGAILFRKKPKK